MASLAAAGDLGQEGGGVHGLTWGAGWLGGAGGSLASLTSHPGGQEGLEHTAHLATGGQSEIGPQTLAGLTPGFAGAG